MNKTNIIARELGVSVYTINRWIRQQKIIAFKLPSGHYLVSDEELVRLKNDGAIQKK